MHKSPISPIPGISNVPARGPPPVTAEVEAVGRVFGRSRVNDEPLYIGSIKTNVGHGGRASALSGVIKGIVSLEGDIVLPNP